MSNYDQNKVQEVLSTYRKTGGVRETSRLTQVPESTVRTWIKETAKGGEVSPEEAELAEECLRKVKTTLDLFDTYGPKEKLESAGAIEKLVAQYLKLMGRAEDKTVVVRETMNDKELDAFFNEIGLESSGQVPDSEKVLDEGS